jgi:lipid-A-disaccharide synthase
MYGAQLIVALQRAYARAGTTGSPAELPSSIAASQPPAELRFAGQRIVAVPTQDVKFFGVGGERMRAAGCDTVVDAKDLAVVGITEILNHLPKILGLYKHLIAEADRRKPNLAIVIDSPAFNWRVARQMKRRGIPTVYYVAPQFWAWRQGRVRLIRDYIDKALVIFPFEEKFYRERGVDATFVGHPLAELPCPSVERGEYARQLKLDPAKQWITLMPGSRMKEVRMNLPTMLEAAARLGSGYEYVLPVAPTLDHNFLQQLIGQQKITLVPEALPALFHSRAGVVASGTATVEAAMMNLPFVMVYRVSGLTYLLGKPRVKVPRFAMVNLIADEEVVPELVQHDFTAANVVARVKEIIPEGTPRAQMLAGLAKVQERLRGTSEASGQHAADRAAELIIRLAQERGIPLGATAQRAVHTRG